ncbi:hypothetical protein ACTFIR_008884 [Dictyostelium discoideum]
MYQLYNKIFKNKYLKNIIFSIIREYNKEQRYIRYNYYDFPFELILKTKNQQLLIEKLNDYKFYFIENQNNINMDTFKYFINFNESCLEQLYIWDELPFELFELIFKIFGNEINEINNKFQINNGGRNNYIANNNNQFQIFGKLFYKHLIKSCNFDKFKFLINNNQLNINKIDLCSLKLLFQEITITDSNKEEKDNEINKRKEMFEFIFNEIDISFNDLAEYLNSLIASKNLSEIYGPFIIDHFPKQIEIRQRSLENCMLSIFEHQNLFIFKEILNKYKYIEQRIDILQSPAELVTIFGIKIEKCVIKAMNIPIKCIFESFDVEITKTLWEDLKLYGIALISLRSLVIINDPNVALYFNEKLKGDISLKKISFICDYRLRKMGMRDQVRFETTHNTKFDYNYLNDNVSKEMIQDLPIGLYNPNEILNCIIKKGCIESFKEHFKKFPRHYNIEHVKNISLLMRDTEFFGLILDNIKFGEPPVMNQVNSSSYHQNFLKSLLEFSIKNDIGKLFDSVSYRLTSILSNDPNRGKSFFSGWVVSNPTLARRWLNNSTLKFYYQETVSEKVNQILSGPNFVVSPNSIIESKFLIGELLNTDFQIKPLKTTKLQGIIYCAIRNEIALTNSHTLSYGFSKIKRIKSLYFKIFCSFYRYYDSLEAQHGKGFILYKIIIKLLKSNILSLENIDSKLFSKTPVLEKDIKNFISNINNYENSQNIITFSDNFKNFEI